MTQMIETRWAAGQGSTKRASDVSFQLDGSEYITICPSHQSLQAAFVARRFAVSDAVARLLAEHAFARRPAR